jgi:hypothetical protein
MELNINLDPEAINKAVAEAILHSAIGEKLNKAINAEVGKFTKAYDNPLSPIIQAHIRDEVLALISDEYADKVKVLVREKLTDELIQKMVDAMWEAFTSKLGKSW